MDDVKLQITQAEQTLKWMLDWVARIDARISTVLGINTAMLGVLAGLAPPRHSWTPPVIALALSAVVLIGTSLLLLFLGAYPRTQGPEGSLIFFGTIAQLSAGEYAAAFRERSPQDYLGDLLGQAHRNAQVVDRKVRDLKGAYQLSFLAITPWALTILVGRL